MGRRKVRPDMAKKFNLAVRPELWAEFRSYLRKDEYINEVIVGLIEDFVRKKKAVAAAVSSEER